MTSNYDAAAQQEWRHEVTDWETKRREEFVPSLWFSAGVICWSLAGFRILDGIADWAVGL